MLYAVIMIIVGYLSGSLPFGFWTAKVVKGIDIRQHGSGSTGATNVYRCVGKKAGIFVFIADLLKGTAPVLIAMWLESLGVFAGSPLEYPGVVPVVVALSALIGHSKSPFLHFQGGKSAATGLGTLFALNPTGGFLVLLTFITSCYVTRIVSVSSVLATFMCIVYFAFLGAPKIYVGYCVVGFLYVAYRHKSNFQRLLKGTEPRIGEKTLSGDASSTPPPEPPQRAPHGSAGKSKDEMIARDADKKER